MVACTTEAERDQDRVQRSKTDARVLDELLAGQLEAFGDLATPLKQDGNISDGGHPHSHGSYSDGRRALARESSFGDLMVDETRPERGSGSSNFAFNLLTRANASPDWQLFTRFFDFLFEARSPDEIMHRAAAGLGLLPQVAWTDVDGQPTSEPGRHAEFFQCRAGTGDGAQPTAGGRWLTVKLDDPHDPEACAMVRSILKLVARLHRRECETLELVDQAHTDPLTGLWNRRGFDGLVEQAVTRGVRNGEQVSVIICDVDHFKTINDVFGHAAGDKALICVARAAQAISRPSDVAVRLGGDEIAILLSGSDAEGAMQVAQRMRAAVTDANPLAPHPLQLSIGIADMHAIARDSGPAQGRERLMAAADEALYAAKAAGRNCARCHEPCTRLPQRAHASTTSGPRSTEAGSPQLFFASKLGS